MTEDSISRIENLIGYNLPERYRQVLLHYPEPLIAAGEFGPSNYDLYCVERKLIEANTGEHELWKDRPEGYFVIGDNSCGNVYAIDATDPLAPVFGVSPHHGEFADNTDGGEPCRVADSIEEYAGRLVRSVT